jgi:hypothetical protein
MVLPSSLWEEEDKLWTERMRRDQPFARVSCATLYRGGQGYNGYLDQETAATLQTGLADDGRTPWLSPWLLSMWLHIPVRCTSWTVTSPLWCQGWYLAQWWLVNHHCAPCRHDLPPCLDVSLLDCRDVILVDFCVSDIVVGHILDLYAGPTTQGRVIRPPLFLHNITTRLGRHIYIYAGTLHHVSRLCRHTWTLAGIRLICQPGRYSYIPARPNLGQPAQSQPLSLCLSSLLTLPGVIPPTELFSRGLS